MSEDLNNDGTTLLAALEVDLDATNALTVDSCLQSVFGRSKERPAPVVQSLLVNIQQNCIREAHSTLLQNYLFPEDDENAMNSLECAKRVTATTWFVQLLLECRSLASLHEAGLTEQEVTKMALSLLQNLFKTLKSKLLQEPSSDATDDISASSFHAPGVACFTIGALLKVIHPYTSTLPFLLSPLWKGTCDLALRVEQHISSELAETTFKALYSFLQEGYTQTMKSVEQYIESRQVLQQQAIQIKILSFLVARCAVLMKVLGSTQSSQERDSEATSTLMTDAATLLLSLRGLTLATQSQLVAKYTALSEHDWAFLNAFRQLEAKAEQCLVYSWILRPPSTSSSSSSDAPVQPTNQRQELNTLLRLEQPESSEGDIQRSAVTSLSFSVGKALVLQQLLVQVVSGAPSSLSDDTIQFLLSVCQELIFVTLPLCHFEVNIPSSTLLSDCVVAMANATVLIYTNGPCDKRSHLDRLLAKWLAPDITIQQQQMHPMTRQVLLSLIHLHILRLCQAYSTRSDSPRSVDLQEATVGNTNEAAPAKPLLGLLVKLLLDARTQTAHRRNIASVVIRILAATNTEASLPMSIRTMLQRMIAVELQQVLKHDVKMERRKRKKKSINDDKASRPLGSFATEDVGILVQVMKRVSTCHVPNLNFEMASVARDVAASTEAGARNPCYTIGHYSRNALSVLLALMSATLSEVETTGENQPAVLFRDKTGTDIGSFTASLVTWLGQQQRRSSRSSRTSLRNSHSIVIVSSLHFLSCSFARVGRMNDNDLRALVVLVQEYIRVSCETLQSKSPPSSPDERQAASSVVFVTAPLLAGVTNAIPTACPSDILKAIASSFKTLFETKSWPIVAQAVTSLVRFASTIPSSHQGILPECIPSETQGLLQCRLQGIVFRSPESHTETDAHAVDDKCAKTLERLIPVLGNEESLYVDDSNDVIPEGSYIVTMPTANGRTAQVIFAPGEESLEEIKYMLGTKDMDDVEIRMVQQVRLIGKGQGCRILSKSL